ncbi:sugar phosphate isomerase/epimerase family protein [Actinomyces howellii]|uniref:Xylose isomerase-like TIM barrel n=1 Tax=Actinomyces howellii TaxID=52771 RepID=A0A448HIE3_9ACTO|nr:TIM barrel protein [Actinomyces howellii]VEG29263.1 Xylose isomerase-like TIM barrel [Actinomyces howellii]
MTLKRGVSLYSLQDAYGRGGLGLEGCVELVERMGAQGIELLSDQMLEGAQNATDETIDEFNAIMERHPLERVANDIFINSSLYRNRWLTTEEQAESLKADLRLASRLGFSLIRLVSRTDPAVVPLALPLAEQLGITMAVEVHAGMSFDHPGTAAWIAQMKELDNPHVGLVVDFGIYCRSYPEVATSYFRAQGLSEDVVSYIADIYASGSDGRQAFPRSKHVQDQDRYEFPEELSRLFRSPVDEVYATNASGYENTSLDTLDEYLPWITSFHTKFWQMVPDGRGGYEEASIDYPAIIERLKRLGFDGYLCSEYEGQRFIVPGELVPDVEQLTRHQQMLDSLINGK